MEINNSKKKKKNQARHNSKSDAWKCLELDATFEHLDHL